MALTRSGSGRLRRNLWRFHGWSSREVFYLSLLVCSIEVDRQSSVDAG